MNDVMAPYTEALDAHLAEQPEPQIIDESCPRRKARPRRRRVDQALFAVVMEAYLHGVSTARSTTSPRRR